MSYSEHNLSHGQKGLWLYHRTRPYGSEYNLAIELRTERTFDVAALSDVLGTLLSRHPMLRTTYHLLDDRVVQRIHDNVQFTLHRIDVAGSSDVEFMRRVGEEARRPFDLERGPVFRTHLFSRSEADQLLLLNFHHTTTDAYSVHVFLEEFGQLYQARSRRCDVDLPQLGSPYVDFVDWQHRMLEGEEGRHLRTYWRDQLSGSLPVLELPTDKPRTSRSTHTGSYHSLLVDQDLMAALGRVADDHGVTPATVLLSVYFILLQRYSGQDEITVFVPRLGRPGDRWNRTFGCFVSLGVLKGDLSANPTFSEFLRQVRHSMIGHRKHDSFPLSLVVEQLKLPQAHDRNPLAQVVFNYTPAHISQLGFDAFGVDLGGLKAEIRLSEKDIWVDLDLRVLDGEEGARCQFFYNSDLWSRSTIEQIAQHYRTLLQAVVTSPYQAIRTYSLLAAEERQEILEKWNETFTDYPTGTCLHHLIEDQARSWSGATAVSFENVQLTYRDLDRRANQLARYLRQAGVQPGLVVGVCVERSPELIVSFLAILKASGVYLPLDSGHPIERLRFILRDAKAKVLLTQDRVSSRLFTSREDRGFLSENDVHVIDLDRDAEDIASQSENGLQSGVSPADLAYIIYTSGSTGLPKGVMVEHRSLRNMAEDVRRFYNLGSNDRVLQFASASFDASIFDFVLALTAGAQLCLAPPEASLPGPALADFLRQERITAAGLTPSAWALTPSHDLPDLKILKSGGEPLPAELAARWAPGRRLVNAYGPTEATVYAVRTDVAPDGGKPMIGRPAINTKIYILDEFGQPVPAGVPGELHIGGVNVARGYVNRPDLTASHFVANPFDADPKARLYRTGDRARYRQDGAIDYLGRDDDQVKIRGMRVELAEIETALSHHAAVSACCALLREDRPGDKRLVAYLVQHHGQPVTTDELRTFLRQRLPDHMVPVHFECLDQLPLTPNGKVDRRALPIPKGRTADQGAELPKNGLQTDIASIWKDILDLESVGLDDNFFDVGGHSLAIVQVQTRIESKLGLRCEIVDLFQNPTIRSISRHLEGLEEPDTGIRPSASKSRSISAPTKAETALDGIAIIGMSGRFPGAADIEQFWSNLRDGVESIAELDEATLDRAGIDPQLYNHERYVRREGLLDDIEFFDAEIFGYSPKDAAWMDPQQRVLLETAWHALEHAGYGAAQSRPALTGVFAGVGASTYLPTRGIDGQNLTSERLQLRVLNAPDFTATRIGYKLDLHGPCVSVQTACSTSLVAVHLACRSLRTGDSDLALAGGASITIPHGRGHLYQDGHIYSPDGRCRAFDAEAQGIVRGSGAAVVVLKRLADAVRDGDFIWAVVKGSAINNDGAAKVGFTAPSVDGQAAVIDAAFRDAGVQPETIGYVEAHGTGTFLGDPIEIAGLAKAFGPHTSERGFCAIGSLKTNVGHLDTAAGVAGLIKGALALHHEVIPPSLNFRTANPNLKLDETPFYVSVCTSAWPRGNGTRRAGVSSFGIGGTNAHVVLEEAPEPEPTRVGRSHQLLALSAATPRSLKAMCQNLADHMRRQPSQSLSEVAHSLQVGRDERPHRLALVCDDKERAAAELESVATDAALPAHAATVDREVVFMFPGQGSQHVGMGRELYLHEKVYRDAIDSCAERLIDIANIDFRPLLYPDTGKTTSVPAQLYIIMQPVFFSVQYAMAELLLSWGIRPTAVIGHSIGECAAAKVAGVISLDDAIRLTFTRGDVVRRLPPGALLVAAIRHDELRSRLTNQLSIAAINGPAQTIISGPRDAVSALHERLQSEAVQCQLVEATHAGHSSMLDPVLGEFEERVRGIKLHASSVPMVSTVTGTWVSDDEIVESTYWVRNLRETVKFASGIAELLRQSNRAFVDIGPGASLAKLAKLNKPAAADRPVTAVTAMSSMTGESNGIAMALGAVGGLWSSGAEIDWPRLHSGATLRRVPLPTYSFEKKRHWIEAKGRASTASADSTASIGTPTVPKSVGVNADTKQSVPDLDQIATHGNVGSGDEIERQIREIFQQVLGVPEVAATDRFFDLGGDSLSALSVVGRIERLTGQKLAPAVLVRSQTPEALAEIIKNSTDATPKDLLIAIQTGGSKPPLFCPHPFGGHVMFYVPLAKALGADQPLFGIQARGLSGEAEPRTSIADMAADYVEAIKHVQPTGPFHFVGLSMGGNIAWEMASQLQEEGEQVAFLGLLDSMAKYNLDSPGDGGERSPLGNRRIPVWLSEGAISLSVLFPELRAYWELLTAAKPDSHAGELLRIGKEKGIIPDMTEEQLSHICSVAEANKIAIQNYVASPRRGKSVLFAAQNGLKLKLAAAENSDDLGWSRYAVDQLDVVEVPGDHYSILKPPHVGVLAEKLAAKLSGQTVDPH